MNIAIIFAGGKGERMRGAYATPKQFICISKKPILIHTLIRFQNHPEIDRIYLAILKGYIDTAQKLCNKFGITKLAAITEGGKCTQDTIYKALLVAKKECQDDDIVILNDGVRPYIDNETITNNIRSVKKYGSGITYSPCTETILISNDGYTIDSVPIRSHIYCVKAPQSFYFGELLSAHNKIREINPNYTNIIDAFTLYTELNKKTHFVLGDPNNIKVTTKKDIPILRDLLRGLK